MLTALIGRWDTDGTLTITGSEQLNEGDQAALDSLVERAADYDGADWVCTFPTSRHTEAIQLAYEQFIRGEDAELVDDTWGHTPTAW
ncbi:hypothetical protein [Kitasatospora sp. MBT63]|uniref:hypothetical protein n=1 Tax=Kitasatospora sp. MBT63 TaxID=1444768 RepID=UPI00053AA1A4|nr:hypothetical protein [Kitasatospora sp. MBT63]